MRILICAAAILAAGTAAIAARAPAKHEPGLTPQQIVAARQAAFGLSGATFGGMKGAVDAGGDVKPLTGGARNLLRWARVLPTMFPAGTATPESHARPALWQNRADFERKAADYAAAAEKLLAAAQANDKTAFAAAWKATGATCGACHDSYRVEEHR
jgi:cytochrome c556